MKIIEFISITDYRDQVIQIYADTLNRGDDMEQSKRFLQEMMETATSKSFWRLFFKFYEECEEQE